MAISFPTSLDNFSNPASTDSLNTPSHSLQHTNLNDAVEALEAKVGIGASPAGSATAGQVLTAGTATGTTIWSTPDAGGLVLISTTSFSAQSAVNISNFTSATYLNYKVFFSISGSTNLQVNMRFRENVTDKATNYYGASWFYRYDSSSGIGAARNNGTEAVIGATKSGGYLVGEMLYTVPNTADGFIVGSSFDDNSVGGWTFAYKCGATNITGLSAIASTGNMTGQISVYGVKK